MSSLVAYRPLALVLLVIAIAIAIAAVPLTGVDSKSFNITNSCVYTVWPGISSGAPGSAAAVDTTGLELAPGQWEIVPVPSGWSGRIWGRTLCSSTDSSGRFTCVTGDCGSGKQDCAGGNAAPPVTLAEFTLDGSSGMDFYDVSLVDGFNLPMLVVPNGAAPGGNCATTGCVVDLLGECPAELRVMSGTGAVVGCKSACLAFGSAEYCCSGEYGNPNTCKPSAYSELFKKACPLAFSYAFDDGADSIFTCGGGGDTTYAITFCANTTSVAKSSGPNSQPPPPGDQPHVVVTVVGNTGGNQFPAWGVVAGALSVLAAVLGAIFGCFKYIIKRRAQGAVAPAES